jgi:CrcB protein
VKSILLVAAGGAIGSVFRYAVSLLMRPEHSLAFPVHTFAVNILGCFVIGLVFSFMVTTPQEQLLRLFIMTGILGGFTTFSSFGLESVYLFQNGASTKAILYIVLSNILGIGAVWLGHVFHKMIG